MFAYAVDVNDVGEAQLTYQWIEQIAKKVDVTLITMGSRINDTCGFEQHASVKLVVVKPRILFRWAGAFDRVFKPDYIELFRKARVMAKKLVSEEVFDALHHIAPHSPRYPSPLYGLHPNFYVGPIHGGLALPEAFSGQNLKTKLAATIRKSDAFRYRHDKLINEHFRSAKKLLISAPYVKDTIPMEYNEKCVVIPPQPPSNSQEAGSEKIVVTPVSLLFVGRLIENKGLRYALQALKGIPLDKYSFTIYGEGEQKEEVENLITEYSLASSVTLKGFVAHEHILTEMKKFDALLFPSLKEAWGLVVTEAMSAGLAVICADRGGPGYIIDKECGQKVAANNPDQFVNDLRAAIIELIENPQRTEEMGRAAKRKVSNTFTWEILTEKVLNLYRGE